VPYFTQKNHPGKNIGGGGMPVPALWVTLLRVPRLFLIALLLLLAPDFPTAAEEIQLEVHAGTYSIPVRINDTITLKFTLDSGATHVSIPADVVLTLERAGTIEAHDFIGTQTYILADGSKLPSPQFIVHELKVGNHLVRNIVASVAPVQGDLLLGQSFLAKLPKWMIDNNRRALILSDESASVQDAQLPSPTNPPAAIPSSKSPPTTAIEANDIRWMNDCKSYCGYPSAYSFVLRNKTQQDILNVSYVVIFYGDKGIPIQSVQAKFGKTILAGLAKTLNSDLGGEAPYPGHEIRKNTRRMEVRILDYQASGPQ
jgi:hypothetical protein